MSNVTVNQKKSEGTTVSILDLLEEALDINYCLFGYLPTSYTAVHPIRLDI